MLYLVEEVKGDQRSELISCAQVTEELLPPSNFSMSCHSAVLQTEAMQ